MIIDCHSHIASSKSIPRDFFSGWIENIKVNSPIEIDKLKSKGLEMLFDRLNNDPHCDEMVMEMDKAGIDKSVLLIIDFKYVYGDKFDDLEDVYLHHKAVMERHPGRFEVFAGIDPNRSSLGIELFEKSIREWGFSGLKVYPPCGFSPSDDRLFPYYEICGRYGVPVLSHVGPTTPELDFKFSWPIEIDRAARLFPNVNFILGHAGSVLFEDASVLAEYRPNIYLDFSGFQNELRRGNFFDIIKYHKSKGIVNKLLFGTDWPIHRLNGTQVNWVQAFLDAKEKGILSESELEKIFHLNIQKLLTRKSHENDGSSHRSN
jgi:predicted TIM-barrel fold metal-dependent hydrolase